MWMLALDEYESRHICPICGMDTDFCHDQEAVECVFAGADVETCFVGEMRELAMKAFADSGEVQAPNSQTTRMRPRARHH
ncbi:hypothetical protein [Bifidobacterium dentium]|uniref:hypothetical protein n=1 Tax=Bifidobacterium dentium TaxID=1689 RepID=UPI002670D7C6|nr:hypothetical protein [Bifidobacterium dentium]